MLIRFVSSYLRTRPAAQAIQFTVDASTLKEAAAQKNAAETAGKAAPPAAANGYAAGTPTTTLSAPRANGSAANGAVSRSEILSPTPSSPAPSPSPSVTSPPMSAAPSEAQPGPSTPTAPSTSTPKSKEEEAAEKDPEFAAALERRRQRELEEAKLLCSIENKEACLMCSG